MNDKELDKIVDQFSIHKPKGYAKGTIARKEMKNKLNKALQAHIDQTRKDTIAECIESVMLGRIKVIGDGEFTLLGTPQEFIDGCKKERRL